VPDWEIIHGDCIEAMKALADNSVDSIVTDPPYELGFMGRAWDKSGIAYNPDVWREALRVLKPGGHLLAFGGTRTYHRMACAIEDAGFEIRDQIQWLYGSGFPKSLDISKAIDKAAGADTKRWKGWGTALKPASEPVCLARKPLAEKTVAANVLKWGTGGLNISVCRIPINKETERRYDLEKRNGDPNYGIKTGGHVFRGDRPSYGKLTHQRFAKGRWPANVILDEEAARTLDRRSGYLHGAGNKSAMRQTKSKGFFFPPNSRDGTNPNYYNDNGGGASRFFYCAKASRKERNAGLGKNDYQLRRNHHPTVKPIKLMRYLCRLITPPGGLVLDPFAGSGSTGCAAVMEGFHFIGIEKEAEFIEIARARIAEWERRAGLPLFKGKKK